MSSAVAAARAPGLTPVRVLKLVVLVAALLLVPPWLDSPTLTTVLISALMFGVFGAIYDLMLGFGGLTNFGYAGFIAVGAYASGLASFHYAISPWIGLLLGGIAGALLGLATGIVTLRLRGLYLGLMTWFVGEAVRLTISNSQDYTRGMQGLSVDPFPDLLGIPFGREHLFPTIIS